MKPLTVEIRHADSDTVLVKQSALPPHSTDKGIYYIKIEVNDTSVAWSASPVETLQGPLTLIVNIPDLHPESGFGKFLDQEIGA
jgi:hypothetical protein